MKLYPAKVQKIIKETSDTYSYILDIPEGYAWTAGQHALWRFQDYEVSGDEKPGRVFTIASAPGDGFLMFTTRIAEPHSNFKDILLNQVKPGDVMLVANPLGSYTFHDGTDRALVIAGGIGITPIRALLKDMADKQDTSKKVTVLYSDDRGEFAYGDFWNAVQQTLPNLDLHLIDDRNAFTEKTEAYAKQNGSDAEYLIAGSPGMNKAFAETLKGLGVAEDRIVTDDFRGY